MGDVRGARAASSPRYARARSSGTRAPPTARRVSALLRSRDDGGVRRAQIYRSISLGIAESDADPPPRLPPRPQLDARLPPELRWISALCSSAYFQPCERHEPAGGKEKEKGELTNFFARDTGETLCPSCVGGRDVVQVRLRFRRDFAEGHAENPSAKATTPSRARTPALARAAARSTSPMDAVFSRIVAQNTRFGRFPFFASASSLAFRVVRAMRKGFVSARRYPRNAARSSRRGARPRGGASLGTPPHRPARPRAVPGPGCDARAARPTAPTPLSRWPSRRLVHDRGKELVFPREISTSAQQNARNETKRDFSLCFLRCFRIRARRETAHTALTLSSFSSPSLSL